jgi:hypothetical protein
MTNHSQFGELEQLRILTIRKAERFELTKPPNKL